MEQEDVWKLIDADTSKAVVEEFLLVWNKSNSLSWELLKFFAPLITFQFTCAIIGVFLSFNGPFFLYHVVSAVAEGGPYSRQYAAFYLIGLFVSSCTKSVIDGQMYFTGRRSGNRLRAILVHLLYEKSLKRASGAQQVDESEGQATLGKIVTLMSVDAEDIRLFASYCHEWVINQPFSVTIALVALYNVIGISALAGIGIILVMIPAGTFLGKMIRSLQVTVMKKTDTRVNMMNEILQGIRIIKYFAWEDFFVERINKARKEELDTLFKLNASRIGFFNMGQATSFVVIFATFSVYSIVLGQTLTAATAFTSINLLQVVSQTIGYLPMVIMRFIKCNVALNRIHDFLKEVELEKFYPPLDVPDDNSSSSTAKMEAIGFKSAGFQYYGDEAGENGSPAFMLREMNIHFPAGGLTLVAGSTGSGKSSLLLALLGELKRMSGRVLMPEQDDKIHENGLKDTVAYVAQTAWLLNATIRENITFGEPYDQQRYEKVLRDCALIKDLQNLKGGDLTEIGEKGINLSGGQKQRISLARACYSRSGYVLLDDPLSAVDAPTARHLLNRAILGSLKGRTVILVSHYVSLVLPYCDYCAVIKNGQLLTHGTPQELVKNEKADGVYGTDLSTVNAALEEIDQPDIAAEDGTGTQLVEAEEKATGSVRMDVYLSYFRAAGGILFIAFFFGTFILSNFANVVFDWWLKEWTDHNQQSFRVESTAFMPRLFQSPAMKLMSDDSVLYYLGVYIGIGVLVLMIRNMSEIVELFGEYFASQKLHAQLLSAVMYSPMRFFETTPLGRILNRFSKDLNSVDGDVIQAVAVFIERIIAGITILVVIGFVSPSFLIIVPFVISAFVWIANVYVTTSRDLKRLESVSRSPVYAQFSETLMGVATIRAYGSSNRFVELNQQKVDRNHQSHFFIWAANRWLCFRIEFLSAITVLFAGLSALAAGSNSGWMALTITYALQFTYALLWSVRFHAEMEMSMNSCERVQEYVKLKQEPPRVIEGSRPPASWPQYGGINVNALSVRYAPDQPDVLKNVSFSIKPHEKVAVVGRTGAGKSTLSLAFFRILPLAEGAIEIDGIDITKIGLYDLRSRLTIIPQDPVLFTGTIRSNLDPFDEHTDQQLWDALNRVHLQETFQTTAGSEQTLTLEYQVTENGQNFSQGQRQLLCLARALLRQTRIIFLDEATASVDALTDQRIQETIRQEFTQGTVITIAHRLRTIIDYDKVLVLDKGQVKEFGSPKNLILMNGIFCNMCEETGEFDELLAMAK
ncbi:P-loop containing nucleoside triphosphate hydrolase protein [Gorgonomyces haynaldii]|nr:P-loop containing nucleoside triphosphate hydrolase protein [Gorgonomyces haynaldii]